MAEMKGFRKAFNGFNKEDVVHYLEHINTKHQNQLSQLNTELEELRANRGEDSSELVASLQEENASLKAQLEEALEKIRVLEAGAAEEPVQQQEDTTSELETYRRAERIEREAKERAELVYFQANNVLKEANMRIEGAMGEMTDTADRVMSQLTELQIAASNSKIALQDAMAVLNTIRPNR